MPDKIYVICSAVWGDKRRKERFASVTAVSGEEVLGLFSKEDVAGGKLEVKVMWEGKYTARIKPVPQNGIYGFFEKDEVEVNKSNLERNE